MTFTTYSEAEAEAVKLGAVDVGVFSPNWALHGAFCAHFFDAAGGEGGFYHYDLHNPLLVLEPRRSWHKSFKDGLRFSKIEKVTK